MCSHQLVLAGNLFLAPEGHLRHLIHVHKYLCMSVSTAPLHHPRGDVRNKTATASDCTNLLTQINGGYVDSSHIIHVGSINSDARETRIH